MKNNQKNAVERGGTQCVEVDVHGIRSGNAVEHNLSQIEAIQSLTRARERGTMLFCVKWEW